MPFPFLLKVLLSVIIVNLKLQVHIINPPRLKWLCSGASCLRGVWVGGSAACVKESVKSGESARLCPATGTHVGSSELEPCRAGFTFFFFLSPFFAIYSEFSPQRINQKVGDGKRNSTESWTC